MREFFLSQQKPSTLNIKIAEYSKLKELLIAENSELESTEADNDEKRPTMMMMTAGSVISRMEQLRVSAKKVHFFPI
jgi:hypothetical protein